MLEHARTYHSRGTLIVPAWRSTPFWPVICPHFAVFVQETILLPGSDLIVPGRSGAKLPVEQGQMLALRLDFQCRHDRKGERKLVWWLV